MTLDPKQQILDDLRWLAKHEQGQRILRRFFVERETPGFRSDTHTMAYVNGRIALAKEVLDDLKTADSSLFLAALGSHLNTL